MSRLSSFLSARWIPPSHDPFGALPLYLRKRGVAQVEGPSARSTLEAPRSAADSPPRSRPDGGRGSRGARSTTTATPLASSLGEADKVGDKVDVRITNVDAKTRRLGVSIKAREIAEEKEAVEQYGSSDSGASLGDILGAALNTGDE